MSSHLIVTGVPRTGTQATPPPRLEINTLVANEKQFSLYIQALQRMYATPQTQGASHFQLGGIHGLPFQPWEGAGSRQVAGSRFGGYCTHGTVLFPTWHRPYLAIYEQILHQHAIDIAKTYTVDAAGWNAAAEQLRMPYWDWASNSVPPAQVISMAQVTITAPNGQRTAVQNPLLGYRFNPIDPSFRNTIYSRWPTTLRHPQTSSANATSNVNEMIAWLRSDQDDIRDSTFNLLTRVKTWPAFSNHTTGDGGSASNSIEAIHDGLHVDIGGNGHMSDPSVAAFDPIFFLHHANVDRITALWQAINPDVWVTRGRGAAGTFTLPATTLQDSNTDLTPFWNAAQTFWDSNDSRDTTKLGYIYPEFVGLNLTDKPAVRAAIGAKVNQLYGSGARSNFAFAAAAAPAIAESAAELVGNTPATHAAPPAAMKLFALPARARAPAPPAAEPAQAPVPAHPAAEAEGSTYTDWTARIHVNKYAVGCSFSVLIFIGPVPEDPAQWRTSESYVGAEHVFVNSQAEECENCRNTAEAELEGFVHLNKAIAARSGLNSFDRAVVEPYLKENLAWRILKVDGSTTDNSEVSSLQVIVVATPLSFEEGEVFPHAGTGRHCHEITEGQPGGYHTH